MKAHLFLILFMLAFIACRRDSALSTKSSWQIGNTTYTPERVYWVDSSLIAIGSSGLLGIRFSSRPGTSGTYNARPEARVGDDYSASYLPVNVTILAGKAIVDLNNVLVYKIPMGDTVRLTAHIVEQ